MSLAASIALGVSLYLVGWLVACVVDEPPAWLAMIVITVGGIIFGIVYAIVKAVGG